MGKVQSQQKSDNNVSEATRLEQSLISCQIETNPHSNVVINAESYRCSSSQLAIEQKSSHREGFMTIHYDNGASYKGWFKKGKRHGYGVYYDQTNDIHLHGEWKENHIDGSGTIQWPEFSYTGQFKEGKRHGQGIFTGKNYSYEGEWQHGLRHGHGNEKMHDGEVYDGQFENDNREGLGKSTRANTVYTGEWKDNKQHGIGKVTKPWGAVIISSQCKGRTLSDDLVYLQNEKGCFIGRKQDNALNGFVTKIDQDGTTFEGSLKDNKREGHGLKTKTDGTKFMGLWRQGNKHGPSVTTKTNGTKLFQVFNIHGQVNNDSIVR